MLLIRKPVHFYTRSKDATPLRLLHSCGRGLARDSISQLTIPMTNAKRNVALKGRYWLPLELPGVSVGTYSPRDARSKTGAISMFISFSPSFVLWGPRAKGSGTLGWIA